MGVSQRSNFSKLLVLLAVALVVLALWTEVCEAQRNRQQRGQGQGQSGPARRRNRNRNSTSSSSSRRNNARRRPTSGRRGGRLAGCEEIQLPMCKGLVSYTHTKLPNSFNHTTQLQVYRQLEHLWAYMDHSCSRNTRLLACALYLPKCNGRRPAAGPCRRTCMMAKRRCRSPLNEMLGLTWSERFQCSTLPNRGCLRPIREKRCRHQHSVCLSNAPVSVCANLTFTHGTLPNMFQQCDVEEINTELQFYAPLQATGCHPNLNFLLCGVYTPFCVSGVPQFTFPCRELCEQIRTACDPHYRLLYHLPWPNKLQCHRYPSTVTEGYICVMPNEGTNFGAGSGG